MISVNECHRQVDCVYDEERYSVRDNGAVLRHPRADKRPRANDNQWTFGKPNSQNGYMYLAQARVHRIVATAFHGGPPTPKHVVDHIDTNRRNNRPENLRWLTRLENALLNPITAARIEFVCGSIEAFLEDPSKLGSSRLVQNFDWMRTVRPEEAQACRERMQIWAKNRKPPTGDGSLGEWVYKPFTPKTTPSTSPVERVRLAPPLNPPRGRTYNPGLLPKHFSEPSGLVMAKTPGAAQRKWRTPTEFPSMPQEPENDPITAYAAKLSAGAVFARNHFSTSLALEVAVFDDGKSMCVFCEQAEGNGIKPWSVAKVTYEDSMYVHTSVGTFFSKEGAEKEFCLAQRLEWTGGDSIDDFC